MRLLAAIEAKRTNSLYFRSSEVFQQQFYPRLAHEASHSDIESTKQGVRNV